MRFRIIFFEISCIFLCANAFLTRQSFTHSKSHFPTAISAFSERYLDEESSGKRAGLGFGYHGIMKPGVISATRNVPPSILKPDYSLDRPQFPVKKTTAEIAIMKEAGRIAREVLDDAGRAIRVGITTDEIDEIVHNSCVKRGVYPSPLMYKGFPKSCCTSVNEVMCHGIPDSYQLQDGDIINVDVTIFHNGFHGDCSETYTVGKVLPKFRKLIKAAHDAMMKGIEACKVGKPYSVIGTAVKKHLDNFGFCSPTEYVGHGIGRGFHEPPDVVHTVLPFNTAGRIEEGHVFTVEPVVCMGSDQSITWDDEWTVATVDGLRSAQFEHTIAMTADGPIRLTERLATSPKLWWEVEQDDGQEKVEKGDTSQGTKEE